MSSAPATVVSGKTLNFRRKETLKSIFNYADENRNAGRFCDVTIKVKQLSLPANKIILAYFSKYFESMFTMEMSEKYQNEVEIKNLDSEAVKLIIDYFYSGSIDINGNNVLKVLAAADYFQVDDVKGFCFKCLESGLTVDNCINVIAAFNMYKSEESLDETYRFVSKHLGEVSLERNFLTLAKNELLLLLSKLDNTLYEESSKYSAIINWIKYDEEARKTDLTELFPTMDLARVENEFLEDVIAIEPLIKKNVVCVNAMLEWQIKQFKKMRLKIRDSKLLCIGGIQQTVEEIRRDLTDVKCTFPDLPHLVSHHGAVCANHSVFCIGGMLNGGSITTKVCKLSLADAIPQWKEVAPLSYPRSCFNAVEFEGHIIVAGGYCGSFQTDSVEIYQLQTDEWKTISPLSSPKRGVALVSCCKGVFALGGFGGSYLSSVEHLTALNGTWKSIAPLRTPRNFVAAVYCDGFIYSIGGLTSSNSYNKFVEKYNLDENTWSEVASMNIARQGHAAAVVHGKIVVVGGLNSNGEAVREIDCYDPACNTWNIIGKTEHDFPYCGLVVI